MSNKESFLNLIVDAQQSHRLAGEANKRLASALQDALRRKMFVGQVINLNNRTRGVDEHLMLVKTIHGNDRKSRTFRIETEPTVEVHSAFVDLAKWKCEATPISEKTGKDMSGLSHGVSARETVTLSGDLFVMRLEDNLSREMAIQAELDRVVAFLTPEG